MWLTGSNVVSVAEHVVMMILTLVRNYMPAHKQIINKDWNVAEIAKEYAPHPSTKPSDVSRFCDRDIEIACWAYSADHLQWEIALWPCVMQMLSASQDSNTECLLHDAALLTWRTRLWAQWELGVLVNECCSALL